jgi:ADP-heptose:LPS heptosyltransferase
MQKHTNYNHATFIFDGAIGEFLIVVSFFAGVHQKIPQFKATIITSRNKDLLMGLLTSYPFIEITDIRLQKNVFKHRSIIFSLMTFALQESWKLRLYKKILAMLCRGKAIIFIYKKEKENINKGNLYYNFEENVFKNLVKMGIYFGIENLSYSPEKFKIEKDLTLVEKFNLSLPYIVLHTFASNPGRSLPKERWQKIISHIQEKYPAFKIVLTGGKNDKTSAEAYSVNSQIISVCGDGNLLQQANIINKASLFIGVDTGLTHLSSLLQKPTILIGNNSNPTWLPNYNRDVVILTNNINCTCNGLKGGNCKVTIDNISYYKCMYEITEKQIFEAVEKIMSKW